MIYTSGNQQEINNTHVDQVSVLHLVSPILLSGGSDGVVRAWDISSNNIQYCLSALGQISKDKAYRYAVV